MVNLILRPPIPLNLRRNLSGSSRRELPFHTLRAHLRALSLIHMLTTITAQVVLSGNLQPLRRTPVCIDSSVAHHNRHCADLNERLKVPSVALRHERSIPPRFCSERKLCDSIIDSWTSYKMCNIPPHERLFEVCSIPIAIHTFVYTDIYLYGYLFGLM